MDKKIWRGYIKHLCKDGSYFWTLSYVQAKLDSEGVIVGFISTGNIAYEKSRIEVEKQYKKLIGIQHIANQYFMD
ncbi:MAG TPA: hypothetical protein ENK98_02210 [Epsilonproteobacteria bacterium]|nr:hypothetical protein [Campylobacterota bacterium]